MRPSFIKSLPIYIFNFVLLILSTQSVSFVFLDNVHAVLFLIPLFYWIIHAPIMMPLWFVFLGGLAIDFSVGSPLGLHAFGFIVYFILLYRVRRIILSQPLLYHFVIFFLSALMFEILRWGLISLLNFNMLDIYPFVLAFVLNCVFCVPIILVLKLLHKVMSGYGR